MKPAGQPEQAIPKVMICACSDDAGTQVKDVEIFVISVIWIKEFGNLIIVTFSLDE